MACLRSLLKRPGPWLLLLVPALSVLFLRNLDHLENYHGDENLWIGVGNRAFQLFAIDHNVSAPFWRDDLDSWGAYHPQVGKYVIGLGTYLAGYRALPLWRYDVQHTLDWNVAMGIVPSPTIIRAARLPVAVLGLVACMLLYWVVTAATDGWHGLLTVCLITGGQLLLGSSRRAMIDTPALCFSILTMLCLLFLLRALQAERRKRSGVLAVTTGVAAGLAASTKMNGLIALAVCAVALSVESGMAVWTGRRGWRAAAGALVVVLLVGAAVFVGTNPFLYHDPVGGIRHMVSLTAVLQVNLSRWAVRTPAEKVLVLWRGSTTYAPLHQLGLPGDGALLLVGCCRLLCEAWQGPARFWRRGPGVLVLWALVAYVTIGVWLPAAAPRYLLPLQPANAVIEAYGWLWLAGGLLRIKDGCVRRGVPAAVAGSAVVRARPARGPK